MNKKTIRTALKDFPEEQVENYIFYLNTNFYILLIIISFFKIVLKKLENGVSTVQILKKIYWL